MLSIYLALFSTLIGLSPQLPSSSSSALSSEYDTLIPYTSYQLSPGSSGLVPWLYYSNYRTPRRDNKPSYGFSNDISSLSSSASSQSSSSPRSQSEAKSLMDDKRSATSGNIGSPVDMIFGKKSEKPFRTWGGR
uniref:Uncharacterized protein n=1 Tax=Tetranychus urticae TaxID=32264 RepID=T1KU95_TETUR